MLSSFHSTLTTYGSSILLCSNGHGWAEASPLLHLLEYREPMALRAYLLPPMLLGADPAQTCGSMGLAICGSLEDSDAVHLRLHVGKTPSMTSGLSRPSYKLRQQLLLHRLRQALLPDNLYRCR